MGFLGYLYQEGPGLAASGRSPGRKKQRERGIEISRKEVEINRKEIEINRKEIEINRKEVEINRKEVEINRKEIEINRKEIDIKRRRGYDTADQVRQGDTHPLC